MSNLTECGYVDDGDLYCGEHAPKDSREVLREESDDWHQGPKECVDCGEDIPLGDDHKSTDDTPRRV